MPYNSFLVQNRVHNLPHTDSSVITEWSIMHYNASWLFFYCKVFEYDKFRTQFLIKHH